MSDDRFFDGLRTNIQNDRIKPALERLKNFISGTKLEGTFGNNIILIWARYSSLMREKNQGLLTDENLRIRSAKIRSSLLYYIDEIESNAKELDITSADLYDDTIPKKITYTQEDRVQYEALVANKLKNINWLAKGVKYAKSVCKIEVRNKKTKEGVKTAVGTGFLLSNKILMTNNHVIANEDDARNSILYFNYEEDINGKKEVPVTYKLEVDALFWTNTQYDFTIVKVKDEKDVPLSNWGYLDIELDQYADEPSAKNHVTIIQHPRGGYKQIALNENQITEVESPYLLYRTDTEQGSSGSPVFNDNWKVIGLHHASVPIEDGLGVKMYHNRGILMSVILEYLKNRNINL